MQKFWKSILVVQVLLLSIIVAPASAQNVTVDNVTPIISPGVIPAGKVITLSIRFNHNSPLNLTGYSNGFRVYSPSSATWTTTDIEGTGAIGPPGMDGGWFWAWASPDGIGDDTVFAGDFALHGPGIPTGFSEINLLITIGPIPRVFDGGTICIDSSWFPPDGDWTWADPNGNLVATWGGPYCFTIQDYSLTCCTGMRGNVNDDPMGLVNVVDVSFLVAYLFQGGQPPLCTKEADIFVSNSLNIVDLNSLVQFLFLGGASPPLCP